MAWSVRDGVTLLGPLRTVYRSRRYGVTLLGPLIDGLSQSPVWGHFTWIVDGG